MQKNIILKTKIEQTKDNKKNNNNLEKSTNEKDWLLGQIKPEKNKTKTLKKPKELVRKKEIIKKKELEKASEL